MEICAGPHNRLLQRQHCSSGLRRIFARRRCCYAATAMLFGQKRVEIFLDFERPICNGKSMGERFSFTFAPPPSRLCYLLAAANRATAGRKQRYHRPRVALPPAANR